MNPAISAVLKRTKTQSPKNKGVTTPRPRRVLLASVSFARQQMLQNGFAKPTIQRTARRSPITPSRLVATSALVTTLLKVSTRITKGFKGKSDPSERSLRRLKCLKGRMMIPPIRTRIVPTSHTDWITSQFMGAKRVFRSQLILKILNLLIVVKIKINI